MDLHENFYWSNTPGSMEVHVIMKKFGLPVNYARHARGNAGNGANIDKHHHQGIFLGVPQGRREATKINIGISHTWMNSYFYLNLI